MTHDHNHDHEHEERELITLVDEQGNETLFEILLTIDSKEEFGKNYLVEALLPDCVVVSVEAMVLPALPWVPVPVVVGPGVAAPESLPPPPHAASTVSTASEASLKEGVETLMAINPNE